MCTNEAIAHFRINNPEDREYTYSYLKNFEYDTLGNTSSISKAVNSKIIKAMPFIMPDEFIKVEVTKGKQKISKLIDMNLVNSIKVIEEDKSMTKSDVVEVIKPEETVVEPVNEEPVVEANPYEYHEMHITSNYIGDGINMDELNAIAMIFKGKRVKVSFEVTEV